MKIYTRGGDRGETDLYDGARVAKDTGRIEVVGALDELGALLGVVRAEPLSEALDGLLGRIQNDLFDVGAEVASTDPAKQRTATIGPGHVEALESDIDRLDTQLEPLDTFILPGGSRPAALLHHARAVCRRAERRLVALARHEKETISPVLLVYANRLGDLLFVAARTANKQAGCKDMVWRKR
ncbi:MAG: cob(I)yrinic acid a,c-diamide adenosyltransferase [Planctomycetia bacterium]|nr:cob(I)yrinic acid a,c-diamide adenosyltransferase [Planctomycetia bacterium]